MIRDRQLRVKLGRYLHRRQDADREGTRDERSQETTERSTTQTPQREINVDVEEKERIRESEESESKSGSQQDK